MVGLVPRDCPQLISIAVPSGESLPAVVARIGDHVETLAEVYAHRGHSSDRAAADDSGPGSTGGVWPRHRAKSGSSLSLLGDLAESKEYTLVHGIGDRLRCLRRWCCIYATDMTTAANLLREARVGAILSRGAVARNAGVPTSTVSRIEDGTMDPTLTMLRRVLAGASSRLIIKAGPLRVGPSIAALAADGSAGGRFVVDWTSFRGFSDWALRHPELVAESVEDPPSRTGTPLDAIIASFAEELCDRIGIDRPRWASDVGAQSPPWAPPGTPKMLRQAKLQTPETFRRRGLTIASTDLFRERAPA